MSTIWTTWTVHSRKALPAKTPCTRSISSSTPGSQPQFPSIWPPMSPARHHPRHLLSRNITTNNPGKKEMKMKKPCPIHTHLRKSLFFFFFCLFFRKTILSDKDYKNTTPTTR
jgi:hypothetical protein